jgi:phosphotransferase system  glucose/maltose/N-acetylglucosamine-specific IIC component
VYRDAKEWSLITYLLAFYPIACMAMGAIAGGYFFGNPKEKKPD